MVFLHTIDSSQLQSGEEEHFHTWETHIISCVCTRQLLCKSLDLRLENVGDVTLRELSCSALHHEVGILFYVHIIYSRYTRT